jgi:CBS domain-containing protein
MRAREIMTPEPACCTPDSRIDEAARLMREHDCGSIPVVENNGSNKLIGVVTDRDIAVRGVAEGRGPDEKVGELMTPNPRTCSPEDDVHEVEETMKRSQIRRVPIIDAAGQLVGIIAQADLARKLGDDEEVGELVEHISEPRRPIQSGQAD